MFLVCVKKSSRFCKSHINIKTRHRTSQRPRFAASDNGGQYNSRVVIAFDATKDRSEQEVRLTINNVLVRGDILRAGDTLVMLGVLDRINHPFVFSGTSFHALEEEISEKGDAYADMLQRSAEYCEEQGVSIEVKITAGIPLKTAVIQEVITSKAAWVVFDRLLAGQFRQDLKIYLKQMPCKLAFVQDSLYIEVVRSYDKSEPDVIEVEIKQGYSMSKPVPLTV